MPIKPLLVAVGLLTRLPVPPFSPPSERELGQSVLAYPVVGLLLGAGLAGVASYPVVSGTVLQAILLLALWVWVTGGLHLDGLADSADAWVGGLGNRARTLAILKDVHSGPMAITTVILVLLLKQAAILELLQAGRGGLLLLPPLLGRSGLLLLFLTTPYARPTGMGAVAARALPRTAGWLLLGLILSGSSFFYGLPALLAWLGGLLLFWLLRRQMLQRLGGTTGDSAGALCELLETGALLLLVQG